MLARILDYDPYLAPYAEEISARLQRLADVKKRILPKGVTLSDYANGHEFFGIHCTGDSWIYREWAPGADALYLTGDFCGWDMTACPMTRLDNGVWELRLPGADALRLGQKIQAIVQKDGELLRRIPAYATRVVQDPETCLWCAEVDDK